MDVKREAQLADILRFAIKAVDQYLGSFSLTPPVDDFDQRMIKEKEKEKNRLREAQDALNRKEFGYCLDCKKEIPVHWLRAFPLARGCQECHEARKAAEVVEIRKSILTRTALPLFKEVSR